MKLFATLVVVMVVLATAVAQKGGDSKETQSCNKKPCSTSGTAISLYLRSKALIFYVVSYKFGPNEFNFNNVWLVHAKFQDDFIASKYWRKVNHSCRINNFQVGLPLESETK